MIIPDAVPMTPEQAAWLSGLVDGEGCLDTTRNSARLRIKMADHDVVLRAAALMPGSRVHIEPARQSHHKDCMVVQVHGDHAVSVMRSILPHLGTRRTAKATDIIVAHSNRQAVKATRHLRSAA